MLIRIFTRILKIFAILSLLLLSSCRDKPHYLGYIEAYLIYVSPPVSGQLYDLDVTRGDSVRGDQKLYQLDPEPERSYLSQAQYTVASEQETLADLENGQRNTVLDAIRANLLAAEAQLALAKITLDRNQRLYDKEVVSQAALDSAKADYSTRLQEVKQLQANLAEAELGARQHLIQAQTQKVNAALASMKAYAWQLSQKTGLASDDGIIFDTFFRPGEFIPAGQPVLAILSPKEIRVLFYVPEPHYSHIKLGQTVWFKVNGVKTAKAVKVSFISKEAEYTPPVIYSEESKSKLVYRVEARLPPEIALKFHPGSPVTVYLQDPK
ncbi:MAG: periplasmic component of efflux system [Gammaproteobacteria bacterium]|jgi:HlyD family secretion protein|nr:periplasmic component of efflux system [Gammaproteobacteria bacterium]